MISMSMDSQPLTMYESSIEGIMLISYKYHGEACLGSRGAPRVLLQVYVCSRGVTFP